MVRARHPTGTTEGAYQLLFEANPQPMWVFDTETLGFLAVNDAALRHYGYSRDEFLGMTILDIRPPEDVPALRQQVAQAPSGLHDAGVWRHRKKDGSIIEVAIKAHRLTFAGRPADFILAMDVTEQRRLEREGRLHWTAFEAAADGIVITDREGEITWVNPAFCQMTGWPAAEAIGKTPRILKSDEHDTGFYRALWDTILSGSVWQGELVNRRKDGTRYLEQQTITPVRDADGRITHFIAIKQDITERKRLEEALRRSEAHHRALVENAPLGIYRSRGDGSLLTVNPALVTMLGYDSAAELLTRNLATDVYVDPAERGRVIAQRRAGLTSALELQWRRKDGAPLTVRTTGRVSRDGGSDGEAFDVFVEDVTEQRRADERLRQAEKLTTLGSLIAGVAHELNNPLTVVTGFAHLLEGAADVPERVRRNLGKINVQAQRAAKIVKNLLTFARQQPPQWKRIRLRDVADQAVDLLAYPLRVNDVSVVKDFAPAVVEITADPDQLLQVFLNVLQNAMHAMAGTEERRVTVRIAPFNAHVRIEFEDTGPGVPPALVARIFDPFFTTKPPGQGTGLGLAICYGIVKGHGGEIFVERAPGGGARFVIELPIGAATAPATSNAPEGGPAARRTTGARVLAVDDEPEILSFLADLLDAAGYRVQTAASGRTALERLERGERYDAIILDVKMPDMDGPTLYRELVRRFPETADRVIFSTGDVVGGDTPEFINASGRPSLMKPYALGEVERILEATIRGSR